MDPRVLGRHTYDISLYISILVHYETYIFLFLYESTLFRNWNHSNWIIQTQVMAFSCQLVILPILHSGLLKYPFFQCLASIFDTGSLYSFNAKVLRVLLQLESPNSEHRNSRYDLDTRDYSMFKTETRIWL